MANKFTIPHAMSVGKTAYFDAEVNNGNSGTADTIDWTLGNKQFSRVTGNVVYTFTNPVGPCNLVLRIFNTGAFSYTWPSQVTWPSGVAPTPTSNGMDLITFYYNMGNYIGQAIGNMTTTSTSSSTTTTTSTSTTTTTTSTSTTTTTTSTSTTTTTTSTTTTTTSTSTSTSTTTTA